MISYEVYKFVHVVSLVLFFTTMTVQLFTQSGKLFKILSGVATLFILVSGMGLLARVGVSHGEPWPTWAMGKVAIWVLLGVTLPVIIKRMPRFKMQAFWTMLALFAFAAAIIIFR